MNTCPVYLFCIAADFGLLAPVLLSERRQKQLPLKDATRRKSSDARRNASLDAIRATLSTHHHRTGLYPLPPRRLTVGNSTAVGRRLISHT